MNTTAEVFVLIVVSASAFVAGRTWESYTIRVARHYAREHLPTSLIKHWSLRAYGEGNLTEQQRDAIWKWLDM